MVVYRVLFQIFGLNHYWPYQAVLVVAHLLVAVLVRAVARRAGADPWVAANPGSCSPTSVPVRVNIAQGLPGRLRGRGAVRGCAAWLLAEP